MHASWNVTLRPNAVVSNGMIAPGMDQNAICCLLDGEQTKLLLVLLVVNGKMLYAMLDKISNKHARNTLNTPITVLTEMEKTSSKLDGKLVTKVLKNVNKNVAKSCNAVHLNGMKFKRNAI
jgi:hypothetical protein